MHGRLRPQDLKGVQLHVDGNACAPYRKSDVGLGESYRDGVELLLLVEEPVLDAGIFNARRWWRFQISELIRSQSKQFSEAMEVGSRNMPHRCALDEDGRVCVR